MFCWVLGLLVLPTVRALRWMMSMPLLIYWVSLPPVSPLAPGVVAFGLGGLGLGVGGGAGVGVAVTGPGCGFGCGWWLGVAGCGRSPLLAEGLVGAASGVLVLFLAALQLPLRRFAGLLVNR